MRLEAIFYLVGRFNEDAEGKKRKSCQLDKKFVVDPGRKLEERSEKVVCAKSKEIRFGGKMHFFQLVCRLSDFFFAI